MLDGEGKCQLAGSSCDLGGIFAFSRKLTACNRQAACENDCLVRESIHGCMVSNSRAPYRRVISLRAIVRDEKALAFASGVAFGFASYPFARLLCSRGVSSYASGFLCATLFLMKTGQFKQTRVRKLTADELAEIDQAASPALSMLSRWANKKMQCAHCKRCTLRCEVLKEPGLDVGTVQEAYDRVMSLPADERPAAVAELMQSNYDMYHALRRCCFCGYCTADCAVHMLAPDRMRDWRELFMQSGLYQPEKLTMVDNEWHIFSAYRAIFGIGYPEIVALRDAAAYEPGTFDTVFFPGCSLVSYAPDLTRRVGEWLTAAGFKWCMSDDCCGSPLMSAGFFDRAAAHREKIFEQIKAAGITRMVTVCPGCGEEFAELMADDIDIIPLPELILERGREMERAAGVALRVDGMPEDVDAAVRAAGLSPSNVPSVTVFDSCHDRHDGRHGRAIRGVLRRYMPQVEIREMDERRKQTLCCGAGGAVAGYDPDITKRRVMRVVDEAHSTGANTLVTMCPTCTYTIAQENLSAAPERVIDSHNYLELFFGQTIDWAVVFDQLGSMWTGEYGPWLNATFFS